MCVSLTHQNYFRIGILSFQCYAKHLHEMPLTNGHLFLAVANSPSPVRHPATTIARRSCYPSGSSSCRLENCSGRKSNFCPLFCLSSKSHVNPHLPLLPSSNTI